MATAFVIHPGDNVATLLADADGPIALRGSAAEAAITATGPIALGHKIALAAIAAGAPVMKFGVPIGLASQPIARGEWVHLHNLGSRFDERSGGFDPVTGAAQDTRYA
jgi:hypothetical protein